MFSSASAALVALALSATGCAANTREATTVAAVTASSATASDAHQKTVDSLVDALVKRATVRGDRTLDLLLLSGGGQHGAYGAGFLRGWSQRGDSKMPAFDLVTGVSTGALQAPFAFLGNTQALDELCTLYRNAADEFAPSLDAWFWIRRTGGLANTSKYRATIERILDAPMQTRMRAEFDSGRRLVLSTTDLDLGVGRVWDLTGEIGKTPEGRTRAHTLVTATSAIPAIFPPVMIDGHLHADGGVIANMLMPLGYDDFVHLAAKLRAAGITDTVTVRIWGITNIWTHAPVEVVSPSSRGDVGDRGRWLMYLAHQPEVLRHLETLAHAVDGIEGLRMFVHVTSVPAAMASEPGANELFDKGWMRRLEQFGFDRARGASPWDGASSAFERPSTTK